MEAVRRSEVARASEERTEGRMNKPSTEKFWGSETILYGAVTVGTCLYTCATQHSE